jgi:aerobic carbon-monoxide dehydrogenase small subunit
MTQHFRSIALTVNGEEVRETVEVRTSLVDFLREQLGLTGSHVGCEQGVCGACTVRLDDVTVRGCLVLAVQCAGSRVETIEGVSDTGEIADLQEAFVRRNALQCGFCTPGMLLAAQELLARGGVPSREEIRAHLTGNYCRCTGYQAIVDAVEAVARARLCSPSPSNRIRQSPNSTCLVPKSGEPDFVWRAGVGSFPRQELAARAPTLPSPASGGGQEERTT